MCILKGTISTAQSTHSVLNIMNNRSLPVSVLGPAVLKSRAVFESGETRSYGAMSSGSMVAMAARPPELRSNDASIVCVFGGIQETGDFA